MECQIVITDNLECGGKAIAKTEGLGLLCGDHKMLAMIAGLKTETVYEPFTSQPFGPRD